MKFEWSETTVLASQETMEAKAVEAIEQSQSGTTVHFECDKVAVKVFQSDTVDHLLHRWRLDYDFCGLGRRQRRSLFRLFVCKGFCIESAAKHIKVDPELAAIYAQRKGWA